MVTFEVLPDEEEQPKQNVHPLVELEGKLRRVEQIESDRNAKKAERKTATKILAEIVQAASKDTLALPKIATPLLRLICRLFHDDSEWIRMSATCEMRNLLSKTENSMILAALIPTLETRLGAERIVEQCEELRLDQLRLLEHVVQQYTKHIVGYMGEMSAILMQVLHDPFVPVRLLANQMLQFLVKEFPSILHQFAEGLVLPLIASSNHQQSKVRSASVCSLGRLLKIAAPELLRKNFAILVQRCFDENANVRYTLMKELVDYLKTYRDRYSFFNLLIPVFFGFLDDEDIFISGESKAAWEEIGILFERENEADLKEEIDFPTAAPASWPPATKRPRIGCRELVSRNVMGMMPGLSRDASDNLSVENRIMATRVFAHVISHCERNIHQHVPKVVEVIARSATDSEQDVANNAAQIAHWLAVLAQPTLVLDIILPGIGGFSTGSLIILTKLTATCADKEIASRILSALCAAAPQLTRHDKTIALIRQTLCSAAATCPDAQRDLVVTEIFCQALMSARIEFDSPVFATLARRLDSSIPDVLESNGKVFVRTFETAIRTWNQHSNEFHAWVCLLHLAAHHSIAAIFAASHKYFDELLEPKEQNQRIRLNTLQVLLAIIAPATHQIAAEARSLLVKMISKNTIFRAGRIETAVRLLAVTNLCLLLPHESSDAQVLWYRGYESTIHSALEDDEVSIRKQCMALLANLVHECPAHAFDADFLHKVYHYFLQRLDDPLNSLRILAAKCVTEIFKMLESVTSSTGYDTSTYGAHTDHAVSVLLLHLDDDDDYVQQAVTDALCQLHRLDSEKVRKLATNQLKKVTNSKRIDFLLNL